jgi:hypothetical protein
MWPQRLARPAPAAEYAELKRRLAREHADDREAYAEGKAAFVPAIHPLRVMLAGPRRSRIADGEVAMRSRRWL